MRDASTPDRISVDELLALRFLAPRLRATHAARAGSAGQHLSSTRARGMDYAESRRYEAGDDVRVMDWKVTARTGKPHTKLFREERERSLFLIVDTNAAMRFGTRVRFKSVQAARAAALAAWLVAPQGDRIGGMAFGSVRASLPLRAGTHGVLALAGALSHWTTPAAMQAAETWSQALSRAIRLAPGGARVMILSDGFSLDAAARPLLAHLRARTEVLLLGIGDPLELAAPAAGRYSVESEGRRLALALDTRTARDRFATELGRGHAALQALAHDLALPIATLDTAASPVAVVRSLIEHGMRR